MNLHDIRELVKLVNQSSIEELEWQSGKTTIVIKKTAPVLAAQVFPAVPAGEVETGFQEAAATAEIIEQGKEIPVVTQTITSTAVGIFTSAVAIGQVVQSGDVVGRCSVDALQLSSDIISSVHGEVVEIFAADGQLVDYGRALMAVKQS